MAAVYNMSYCERSLKEKLHKCHVENQSINMAATSLHKVRNKASYDKLFRINVTICASAYQYFTI